ncbi:MAG: molybdopterin molybdotransferase [Cellvibrionaceae bacterium]|jgi:molybdopterin molybdotransferase
MFSVDQALEAILSNAVLCERIETVSLDDTLGRTLAESQVAGVDVPPADNSAMDGYAIHTDDLSSAELTDFVVHQTLRAGVAPQAHRARTATRIFTGAEIPPGANAVVMQERCSVEEDRVSIPSAAAPPGNNIRPRGQDIQTGDIILQQGTCLQAQHIGLLASVGIASVKVYKPLTVALLSTGNELVEPGENLQTGKIYNSNRYLLKNLLKGMGLFVQDLGIIIDDLSITEQALKEASKADCIISTGGVSVGEEDYVKTALENAGELNFWRIAMKPGKPLAFGQVYGTYFFGLPGNPVSSFVTFLLFVRPFLLTMQGQKSVLPKAQTAVAAFSKKANPKRQEYLRVTLEAGKAYSYGNQSSGVLSSVVAADAFATIPAGSAVTVGDLVEIIPFSELF